MNGVLNLLLTIISALSEAVIAFMGVRLGLLPPEKRWRKNRWLMTVAIVGGVGFLTSVWLSVRAGRAEAAREAAEAKRDQVSAEVKKTLEPSNLAVEIRPLVVVKHIPVPASLGGGSIPSFGLSIIVHATNSGGVPGFIKLLRLDGEVPPGFAEFLVGGIDPAGLTFEQVGERLEKMKPFRVLAWRVPPFIDEAKVEHGADRYFLFDVIMPETGGAMVAVEPDGAPVFSEYLGSSTAGTQPKRLTTSPYILHLLDFGTTKTGDVQSLRWRDEVTSGKLRFSVDTDTGTLSVPATALRSPMTNSDAELRSRAMRDLFEGVDSYRVMPPR